MLTHGALNRAIIGGAVEVHVLINFDAGRLRGGLRRLIVLKKPPCTFVVPRVLRVKIGR
jgi:hypothetical protein